MKKQKKQPEVFVNNLGRILIIGIVFVAIGMISIFAMIDRDIGVVDSAWQELNIMRSEKQTELFRLQASLGYNGVINHFKNYILRQDANLLTILNSKLGAAEEALNTLKVLSTTEEERTSVEAIGNTISLYTKASRDAEVYISENKSVEEIDELDRKSVV